MVKGYHGRHIHFNLRVASARLIAEHPSLSIQSGDLVCVTVYIVHIHTFCMYRDGCPAISLAEATRRFKCLRRPCFLNGSQQYLRTSDSHDSRSKKIKHT